MAVHFFVVLRRYVDFQAVDKVKILIALHRAYLDYLAPEQHRLFHRMSAVESLVPLHVKYDIVHSRAPLKHELSADVLMAPCNEVVVRALAVEAAVFGYLDYAVSRSLEYLVIVGSEQQVALEFGQAVVYRGDALEVEVVGRTVEDKHVALEQHHS